MTSANHIEQQCQQCPDGHGAMVQRGDVLFCQRCTWALPAFASATLRRLVPAYTPEEHPHAY